MKIAIIGYGKMGKTIESLCINRNHQISKIIDLNNEKHLYELDIENTDVAIEFTNPEVAFENLSVLAESAIPTISGTTGWLKNYDELCAKVKNGGGAFLYSSNFSIGVNLFFALNRQLAAMMNNHNAYNSTIEEIHHIHKLDSPSGTAISLAEGILESDNRKNQWINDLTEDQNKLSIVSKRIGETPGTHIVRYESEVDQITITHEAFSRQGFALGAVIAAEWIYGKKGIFGMDDVLKIGVT